MAQELREMVGAAAERHRLLREGRYPDGMRHVLMAQWRSHSTVPQASPKSSKPSIAASLVISGEKLRQIARPKEKAR
jgi:hypothetical protein